MKTTTPTSKKASASITIPDRLFFRIGDVADLLKIKPHVLRYWETEFSVITPRKSAAGQRVYRRSDVETLVLIRHLLHEERYSIEGARKRIREIRKSPASSVQLDPPQETASVGDAGVSELRTAVESLTSLANRSISELFRF